MGQNMRTTIICEVAVQLNTMESKGMGTYPSKVHEIVQEAKDSKTNVKSEPKQNVAEAAD